MLPEVEEAAVRPSLRREVLGGTYISNGKVVGCQPG